MSRRKQAAPQRRITDLSPDDIQHVDHDEEASSDDEWPFQQQKQQQQQARQQQQLYQSPPYVIPSFQCYTSSFQQLHAFAELLVTTKASLTADASEEQHHASPERTAPHDGPVSCIEVQLKNADGTDLVRTISHESEVLQLSWQVPGQPADVRHKVRAMHMQHLSQP
jgi:hypothetical protein